ncbi:hypothetical protein F5148DRAFT_1147773 [Russula earlei]|uniref:Uncharacterized protein n=1 Tax=Russula earlei TaxID=71964 RepID=A0ACC0UGF0_9AGAM|nr:hypothetical protein F5148DRAFT_1147773 [Russula earlei]
MRISSVFVTLCLAVGIAPSFALPTGDDSPLDVDRESRRGLPAPTIETQTRQNGAVLTTKKGGPLYTLKKHANKVGRKVRKPGPWPGPGGPPPHLDPAFTALGETHIA